MSLSVEGFRFRFSVLSGVGEGSTLVSRSSLIFTPWSRLGPDIRSDVALLSLIPLSATSSNNFFEEFEALSVSTISPEIFNLIA